MTHKIPHAWQRMLSGRRLDLLDPSPVDIEISDIAHGLARVARWNGQTEGDWAYSVAQHSILVARIFSDQNPKAERRWRLAALLHDAPEYVIGDMIAPFKAAIGTSYRELEHRLEAAIHIRFGIPARLPTDIARKIKQADIASARLEAVSLAGFSAQEAEKIWKNKPAKNYQLLPAPPKQAQRDFLSAFQRLAEPNEKPPPCV